MYSEKVLDHFTNPMNIGEIEKAEESIRNLGISLVRVRDYFPEARIEVLRSD